MTSRLTAEIRAYFATQGRKGGKKGGKSQSADKIRACKLNGLKGGRPRKKLGKGENKS